MNLLNPKKGDIEENLKKYFNEWRYADNLIYNKCIKDMKNINLCKIKEKDIKGPIKTFLINWGLMGRVLLGIKKGWEGNLLTEFPKICKNLEKFKKFKLENIESMPEQPKSKEDIKKCYQPIRKIVGPTSASKILHLIAPDFFPMWDTNIRKKLKGIGESAEGYYKFMIKIKEFLENHKSNLKLSKKDDRHKIKIIDSFLWIKSKKKK